jgi:hypothetical protein
MTNAKIFTVLTTINSPDKRVSDWKKITQNETIVIGDKKTPTSWNHPMCDYFSLSDQKKSGFTITNLLPENHYTRKNIGYLYAIKNGANAIIDTDDDNFPLILEWHNLLSCNFDANQHICSEDVTLKNIYSYFSNTEIPFWPRGFPLNLINIEDSNIKSTDITKIHTKDVGVWQCMVNGDPDIDAIHRLIYQKTPQFNNNRALIMGKNIFCPFNSQNTIWIDSDFFPLLYLPSTVSFRFTDILRGYIAQSVINSTSKNWGFFQPTSYQERNDHNLMNDFRSEVSMYSNMEEIFQIIFESCKSTNSIVDNLTNCYTSLSINNFVKDEEHKILNSWLTDLNSLQNISSD